MAQNLSNSLGRTAHVRSLALASPSSDSHLVRTRPAVSPSGPKPASRVIKRPVPMSRMRSTTLVCALLTGALCACSDTGRGGPHGGSGNGPMQGELRRREATRVRTAPLARKEMVRTLSTATTVESEYEIDVFSRVAGFVTGLHVEEGDRVESGDELASLDEREARAALDEAKVALRETRDTVPKLAILEEEAEERWERAKLTHLQAQRDFERNESAGLISAQELDRLALARDQAMRDERAVKLAYDAAIQDGKSAQTSIDRAQLTVDRRTLELSYYRITAPFAGVIASRAVRIGDSVGSAQAAFVLTDPDRLRAVFHRPQRELRHCSAVRRVPRACNGAGDNGPRGAPASNSEITAEADRARRLAPSEGLDRAGHLPHRSTRPRATFRVTARLDQPEVESGPDRLLGRDAGAARHRSPSATLEARWSFPSARIRREGERRH